MITKKMVAEHLAWLLSNTNHELEIEDVLVDVAFNSWVADGDTEVVQLGVEAWNAETGEHVLLGFQLAVVDAAPDDESDGA